jgi:hypothetical protein
VKTIHSTPRQQQVCQWQIGKGSFCKNKAKFNAFLDGVYVGQICHEHAPIAIKELKLVVASKSDPTAGGLIRQAHPPRKQSQSVSST